MTIDPRFYTEMGIVTRIDNADIEEVSNVDEPATAIEFAMFKSIENAAGLADVEACLKEDIATPTECESRQEGWGNLLRADVRSHEDSGSPPDRTETIKGGTMSRKIEALAGDPGAPPPPADLPPDAAAGGDVIEIPATPVDWSLPDCIQQAIDLGLGDDQAGQTCMLIRDQYGAAGEEGKILVPEGVKPEALLAAAAESLGFAQLAGKSVTDPVQHAALVATFRGNQPLKSDSSYRGVGRWWEKKINAWLGRKTAEARPGGLLASYLKGLREELMAENVKTRQDLHRAMQMQDRANRRLVGVLAGALNIQLPPEDEMAEGGEDLVGAVAEAAAAQAPAAPPANPLAAPKRAKGQKCGVQALTTDPAVAPAVAPAAPVEEAKAENPTDSDRIARLEGLVEQLLVAAGGAPPIVGDEFDDEIEAEEDAELVEETLAIAGAPLPGKRASSPLGAAAERIAQSKAATVAALSGRRGLPAGYTRSSFTGMVTSEADQAAVRANRGVTGLHFKR